MRRFLNRFDVTFSPEESVEYAVVGGSKERRFSKKDETIDGKE